MLVGVVMLAPSSSGQLKHWGWEARATEHVDEAGYAGYGTTGIAGFTAWYSPAGAVWQNASDG